MYLTCFVCNDSATTDIYTYLHTFPYTTLFRSGPGHADHDGVDRLEVARVGGQLDGDVLAGAADELADLPEVVLHVAGALHRVGVDLALELLEDLVVALAHDVCEHVEAPAVGHADHRAVEVVVGRRLEDRVEDGYGRLRAL